MNYRDVNVGKIPKSLLLNADPSLERIHSYLQGAWGFAADNNSMIVGAVIAKLLKPSCAEIFNISVVPEFQKQGIGIHLLQYSLQKLKSKGVNRVELGTGTFGYQLTFYQRNGFRVDCVEKDFFVENYPEPIFENGIQHVDMLRLSTNI